MCTYKFVSEGNVNVCVCVCVCVYMYTSTVYRIINKARQRVDDDRSPLGHPLLEKGLDKHDSRAGRAESLLLSQDPSEKHRPENQSPQQVPLIPVQTPMKPPDHVFPSISDDTPTDTDHNIGI